MPPSLSLVDTAPAGAAAPEAPGCGRHQGGARGGGDGATPTTMLVRQLRSPLGFRPAVDPALSGGLRAWLEDAVATAGFEAGFTIRPGAEDALVATGDGADRLFGQDLRTAVLRAVFRLTVTTGPPRASFEDALAALAVDEEGASVVEAVQRLSRHRRAQLRERVRHVATGLAAQWSPPPAAWMPRTGERLVAPLAGGRVVLRSHADLMMGGPSSGQASVCALRVHGGAVADDGSGRRFLALLETLRSGAAPFRVASYDLDRGRLTTEDVTDELLSAAVRDVLALLHRHADRAVMQR